LSASAADNGQVNKAPNEPNRDEVILRDLRELRLAVENLTRTLGGFQSASMTTDLEIQKTKADIADIRRTIAQIQKDLDGMNQRMSSERRSAYPPTQAAPSGRIRLVNTFAQPVTIIVNARAYTLQPGETRQLDAVPTGAFAYEVLGIQPPASRTLEPNETFTITVHPR